MKRRPIQIVTLPAGDNNPATVYALCDNGEIFFRQFVGVSPGEWSQLVSIPQPLPWWRRLARRVFRR